MTSNNLNYVRDVAEALTAQRHEAVLNARYFAIIAEWQKEDIPLAVVLRSINESCEESGENVLSIEEYQEKAGDGFSKWLKDGEA